jgi:hypothetical protein
MRCSYPGGAAPPKKNPKATALARRVEAAPRDDAFEREARELVAATMRERYGVRELRMGDSVPLEVASLVVAAVMRESADKAARGIRQRLEDAEATRNALREDVAHLRAKLDEIGAIVGKARRA